MKAEIVSKAAKMGFVAKEASFAELNNTFAGACVDTNTLDELLHVATCKQDAADMAAWGLSPDECKRQIRIAVEHIMFVMQEN